MTDTIESLRAKVQEQAEEIERLKCVDSDLVQLLREVEELTRQRDEAMKDSENYNKLCEYLIGPRTDLDDLIIAAKTKDEISEAIKENKP